MISVLAYVFILTVLPANAIEDDNLPFNPVETLDAPYIFGYNSTHDTISMTLCFNNNFSSAVMVSSMEHRQSVLESQKTTHKKDWKIKARQKYYYNYHLKLNYEQINWQLVPATNASCFDPVKIFYGTAIDRKHFGPRLAYDDRCLRSKPCVVNLNLQDNCLGTTSVTTEKSQKGIKEMVKTVSQICYNEGATFVTVDKPQKGSETSILVIVLASLLSIVFVVLVIVVICICCVNRSAQGTHGVQTNHTEPFYVNMLFRRECDQEIADIEQHHYYEEIEPGAVEGRGNVR